MQGGSTPWLLMVTIVVLNTIAQTLLKMGSGRPLLNPWLGGGIAAYGVSTLLYMFLLGRANLSYAYPVVIGATAIATCFASVWYLGERIVGFHWVGIALIIAGIAFVTAARA